MRTALVTGSLAVLVLAPSAFAADATQTVVSSSVPAPVYGQLVTFTATVSDTPTPGTTPTGSVQFSVDDHAVGSPVPLAAGQATLSVNSLEVGNHKIAAAFAGGADFAASQGELHPTIAMASVSVRETISPDPSVAGQSADYIARVDAQAPSLGTPTGTVTFSDENGPFASADLSGGVATVNLRSLAGGFNVTATYSGDLHFKGESKTIPQTVNKAATATTLAAATTTPALGQDVDLTAMVAVQPPGAVPTFGSLQFIADGRPLGDPIPLDGHAGVVITVTMPTLPGVHTVGVAYSGDDNTTASAAPLVQITVGPPPPPPPPLASQLKSMGSSLMSALRKRGFAALAGTAEQFTSPGAGVLTQEIDSPKARASKAKKPIQIAKARLSFNGPGQGTLKLKLTAAGKRAIRKAKSLKIAIVTKFAPAKGEPVRVVQRLTVKAKRGGKVAVADSAWAVRDVHRAGPRQGQLHGRI
jgi:hypothetical protein